MYPMYPTASLYSTPSLYPTPSPTPFSGAAGGCPFWAGAPARAREQKALPEKNLEPPRHKDAKDFSLCLGALVVNPYP